MSLLEGSVSSTVSRKLLPDINARAKIASNVDFHWSLDKIKKRRLISVMFQQIAEPKPMLLGQASLHVQSQQVHIA